jgi:transposase-like protein
LNEFPTYKGGDTCVYGGYVWEFLPGHRLQNHWGWVAQHRLIGEDIAGRPLVQSADPEVRECVHHRDENRLNNDPSNLEVLTFSEHRSHHSRSRAERRQSQISEEAVREALTGGNIKRAAKTLGIDYQTMRNRWPHLLAPYQRKSPLLFERLTPEQIEAIRRYAADPEKSMEDCALEVIGSYKTIASACKRLGIEWVRRSKQGEVKWTYRGQPTPKAQELHALGIAPEPTSRQRFRQRLSTVVETPSGDDEAPQG